VHGQGLLDGGVGQRLGLLDLLGAHRVAAREVEAQAIGCDERAALIDLIADDRAQGVVEQVRARVVGQGGSAAIQIDGHLDLVPHAQLALDDAADVQDVIAELLGVLDAEAAVAGGFGSAVAAGLDGAEVKDIAVDRAAIADLAPGFGVVVGSIEDDGRLAADVNDIVEVLAVPDGLDGRGERTAVILVDVLRRPDLPVAQLGDGIGG